MLEKRKLKKMGYKGVEDTMKIEDIIALGKMGYTKDEIEAIRGEEKETAANAPVIDQINALKSQLDDMLNEMHIQATHETVHTDDVVSQEDLIDQGLSILAGGEVNA